ncbi:MAG: hypothetical protein GQ569_04945, partial [Methylococcaceae bacterium]|nr:hypothetical protein [Methylococcaceae bacterium]
MLNKKQLLLFNCAGLFAYILSAYIGQWFLLPPSGVSPIWPPAGVALGLLLLYRNGMLPSIFLGSLIVQSSLLFNENPAEPLLTSLLLSCFISLGVCLQAMLGSYLIKRFVGENNPLIKDFYIVKFLFLGAVTGSAIAPVFKTIVLLYIHAIDVSELFSIWAIEWLSYAIGILIITPLMLIFFAQPRELWLKRRNYIVYPMIMLLCFVVLIFQYNKWEEDLRIKAVFHQKSSLLHDALSDELNSHIYTN